MINPHAESSCGETLLLRLYQRPNGHAACSLHTPTLLRNVTTCLRQFFDLSRGEFRLRLLSGLLAPKGRYTSAMGAAHRQRLQLSQAAKRRNTNLVESRANLQIAIFLSSSPLLRALFALICLIFFKVDSSH